MESQKKTNMRYQIVNCTIKDTQYGDVRDMTVTDVAGNQVQGSMWRKQKDGTEYPNFDAMLPGAYFEATAWVNPKSGKISFFPPKTQGGAFKRQKGGIASAMKVKAENIKESQERKHDSIKSAGAIRDSVLVVTTLAEYEKYNEDTIRTKIEAWREWFLSLE